MDARERELEQGLTEHIQKFLLGLGVGFAFVGRQLHLKVGGDESLRDSGGQRTERVRVIGWDNPASNDFLLVSGFHPYGFFHHPVKNIKSLK